jgi:shikimate kinase
MVITLVGYRGVGKSTVAPELARRLGWSWMDADVELERRAGCSIAEMFRSRGESSFRALEADILADLLSRDRLVLAAGGGAVLNDETRRRMQQAGPVVWLSAPIDVLVDRLARDASTGQRRPSLTGLPPYEEIRELLARREPLYAAVASVRIDTADRSVEEIVAELLPQLACEAPASPAAGESAAC